MKDVYLSLGSASLYTAELLSAPSSEAALGILDSMRAGGVLPNNISYNAAIRAACKHGDFQAGLALCRRMGEEGFYASEASFEPLFPLVQALEDREQLLHEFRLADYPLTSQIENYINDNFGDEAADVKKITVPVPRLMYENDLRIKERKIQRQQNEMLANFVDTPCSDDK